VAVATVPASATPAYREYERDDEHSDAYGDGYRAVVTVPTNAGPSTTAGLSTTGGPAAAATGAEATAPVETPAPVTTTSGS
jgi:hypothetical protein